jgi:3-hydroxyacyl-CoA dehydrogenase
MESIGGAKIAVVGTGTVGASWAAFYLARGFDVCASDPGPGAEAALRRFVDDAWPSLVRLGIDDGATRDRLTFSTDLSIATDGAFMVQESAPEREDLKVELFGRLGELTGQEVLLASSSSGLLMTRVQQHCRFPDRCVTAHPFNPPHLIPLVEVVGGALTSQESIERALSFYESLGKHPVHVRKEVVGHIANRLQAAVFREAASLVANGVASASDVDTALTYGPGLRWAFMGPILTFHLAGGAGGMEHFLDHLGPAVNTWINDLATGGLDQATFDALIAGADDEAAGRTVADLVRKRDAFLVDLIELVAKGGKFGTA